MVKILPAGIKDIPIINSLAHSIWPVAYKDILSNTQMDYMLDLHYNPSSLQKQIQNQSHQFLILYFNDEPSGFASFSAEPGFADTYKLHKLYVQTKQQGAGFGKALLNHVIDLIKKDDGKYLRLNVNRNNKALQFYLKHNFRIVAEEDVDIGNGYFMNDYIMQKKL
ncbi:MAG: GNAT family N-acetyltransferase [Ginsengibacter sp.]